MIDTLKNYLLVHLLSRLKQPWSYNVFRAISKIVVTSGVEVVILRKMGDRTEVLLTRRASDDPDWPGMWHLPGTVLRNYDTSYEDALRRLESTELKINLCRTQLVKILLADTERGKINKVLYLCTIDNEPRVGRFYDVKKLPKNFTTHQQPALDVALEYFQNEN